MVIKRSIILSLCAMPLFASLGSSIKVPAAEHMKYLFGNHRFNPIQKLEEKRYLHSLSPLHVDDIQKEMENKGFQNVRIELKDVASELVYEVYADSNDNHRLKLYIDPQNATVLKEEIMR